MVEDQSPHQIQLEQWKKEHPVPELRTLSNGAPIDNRFASLSVGPHGPLLMQDFRFFEELGRFDRERIPERVVHAKGGGAHGFFEVTKSEITKYCKADLFSKVGKKTPVFIRFSTVAGEAGSADTARDPRGFAVRFYTEEGNWDLVGNNTPVFFIRDAILFPHFIHSQKRNPVTGLKDPNMAFDFFTNRPETTHQVMILYSDRGIPDGWRFMHGYGGHTFKLVNEDGNPVYCKFHLLTKVIKNLPTEYANKMQAEDPDYSIRDLYDAIARGEFPEWKFCVQVMTFEQAEKYKFNPFDLTKVWSHKDYPLIEVGKIVLNKNPKNYFEEVEQIAFCPGRIVPGIEFSPDKMLQGRIFSYHDTQVHRIGPNYLQLPINCPYRTKVRNYQRDGYMTKDNQGGAPVYTANSYNGPIERADVKDSAWSVSGNVDKYNSGDEDNFTQPKILWSKVFNDSQRQCLIQNLACDLCKCKPAIQKRAVEMFSNVHEDFGVGLQCALRELGIK